MKQQIVDCMLVMMLDGCVGQERVRETVLREQSRGREWKTRRGRQKFRAQIDRETQKVMRQGGTGGPRVGHAWVCISAGAVGASRVTI
eukprot:2308367-Pleurochrysis_carterae.AAC.2